MTGLAHGEGVDLVAVDAGLELVHPLVLAVLRGHALRVADLARDTLDALETMPSAARNGVQSHAVNVVPGIEVKGC